MKSTRTIAGVIGAAVLAAALSGCGAGADETPVASADTGRYQEMVSYCQAQPQEPAGQASDGWVMSSSYVGNGTYSFESNALVSLNGSTGEGAGPVPLKVSVHEYRGVAHNTPIVPIGYTNPDWSMGVVLPNAMAARSVACVAQLAKTRSSQTPTFPTQQPTVTTVLYWRSFWNADVPMTSLSGYQIDGFEFVSNFTPADGQAYFVLDKQRYPTPYELQICFLAPGVSQWSCSQPDLADLGARWRLRITGARPGVYVLNAPAMGR